MMPCAAYSSSLPPDDRDQGGILQQDDELVAQCGSTARMACGMMMTTNGGHVVQAKLRPASIWPGSTAIRPPRMISET